MHAIRSTDTYAPAMGQLLNLYTQVDRLIMEICAERIAAAPNSQAQLGLAKQVGDEARHVVIQSRWMEEFGAQVSPLIAPEQEAAIRAHFQSLSWIDFLADMYLVVEGLGTQAVEELVPLADPGTRESLRIPLADEIDHVTFGLSQLKKELAALSPSARQDFIHRLPARIDGLTSALHTLCTGLPALFTAVGADYGAICAAVMQRRAELLDAVTLDAAA